MPSQLPQDLPRLRSELQTKFAGCGAATRAAGELVLNAIDSLWDDEQGIPSPAALEINRVMGPLFDAVLSAPTPGAVHTAVDDLVATWRALAPTLDLRIR